MNEVVFIGRKKFGLFKKKYNFILIPNLWQKLQYVSAKLKKMIAFIRYFGLRKLFFRLQGFPG